MDLDGVGSSRKSSRETSMSPCDTRSFDNTHGGQQQRDRAASARQEQLGPSLGRASTWWLCRCPVSPATSFVLLIHRLWTALAPFPVRAVGVPPCHGSSQ
jgi:hypothetical protein